LSAAQQQRGNNGHFRRGEFQIAKFGVAETLLIFSDTVTETTDCAQVVALYQRIQYLLHLMLAEVHYRFTVGFWLQAVTTALTDNGYCSGVVICFSSRHPITRASVALSWYFMFSP
jgi:hypothetical protein